MSGSGLGSSGVRAHSRLLLSSIKQATTNQQSQNAAGSFFSTAAACTLRRPTSSIASNPAFALSFSQNNISQNGNHNQRSFHSSRQSNLFKSRGFGAGGGSEETKAADGSADQTPEETPITKEEYEKLATEVADLKAKSDDLLDKYRRSIAENDNMRKRLTKQIEDAKVYGIQGFCKDLLDVADVLGKAVEAGEQTTNVDDMVQGLKLTQTQLLQVFGRHGLAQITPQTGETKFDPNLHEALFQIPNPNLDPNIVLDVQKIGYTLHGRTIRPALVGVSKK